MLAVGGGLAACAAVHQDLDTELDSRVYHKQVSGKRSLHDLMCSFHLGACPRRGLSSLHSEKYQTLVPKIVSACKG